MGAPPSASPMDDGEEDTAADAAAGPAAVRRWWPCGGGGPKAPRGPPSPPRPLPCAAACPSHRVAPAAAPPPPRAGSSGEQILFQTARKRNVSAAPSKPSAPACGASLGAGAAADEGVAALLPKMKRMRLRPSLGQLRLQREADDANALPPQVRLCVEPEQLRAAVSISLGAAGSLCGGGSDFVHLELSFPPQYPHKPPQVVQVSPVGHLPAWKYEGRFVALARLTERCWSSAMGVADIVRDLLEALSEAASAGARGCCQEAMAGLGGRFPPVPLPPPPPPPDDVEMA